ncbi:hypothetical protein NDU88_002180 [Pleurodeles waltl]|uniref:Uncharacterized protein n=1 Tax=Pleurodeles waltl TaxID=8319 RepID=A0AAV7UUY9_PLEWA|nr:hypothetical protein NDU88_002180 [Pleurodeles waltl]
MVPPGESWRIQEMSCAWQNSNPQWSVLMRTTGDSRAPEAIYAAKVLGDVEVKGEEEAACVWCSATVRRLSVAQWKELGVAVFSLGGSGTRDPQTLAGLSSHSFLGRKSQHEHKASAECYIEAEVTPVVEEHMSPGQQPVAVDGTVETEEALPARLYEVLQLEGR